MPLSTYRKGTRYWQINYINDHLGAETTRPARTRKSASGKSVEGRGRRGLQVVAGWQRDISADRCVGPAATWKGPLPRVIRTYVRSGNVKRARLDETVSTRGEHKKQKFERLAQGAEERGEEDVGPQLRDKPIYNYGTLKLWCLDKAPARQQWLEDAIISSGCLPGMRRISLKNTKVPRRVVCGLLITGEWEQPRQILKWQNKWADHSVAMRSGLTIRFNSVVAYLCRCEPPRETVGAWASSWAWSTSGSGPGGACTRTPKKPDGYN